MYIYMYKACLVRQCSLTENLLLYIQMTFVVTHTGPGESVSGEIAASVRRCVDLGILLHVVACLVRKSIF